MRTELNKDLLLYVSDRIKTERTKKGLSQNQLSLKAGLNYTYIGMIERQRYLPSLEVLSKICKALEIKMSDFFKGLDNE